MVALVATAAFVAPAFAEFKVSGYYRTQGIATNSDDSSVVFDGQNSKEPQTQSMVDARLRAKIAYSLNDMVTLVHYSETDASWGDAGKDGGPGGDRVGIETKNLYLNVKKGMVDATVGLQGLADRYEGLVVFDDWSAAKVALKLNDATKLTLLWAKPDEGDKNQWDDTDLYMVSLDADAGAMKLGLDLGWLDSNMDVDPVTTGTPDGGLSSDGAGDSHLFTMDAADTVPYDLYIIGGKVDAGMVNAFLVYVMGEEDVPNGDEIAGFAASVAANAKVNNADVGGRVLYLSADDFKDNDSEAFIPNLGGNFDLYKENLMIMYTDIFYNNGPGGRLATEAATAEGTGLIGVSAKANLTMGDYYAKFGAGYFMAADTPTGVDDDMGYEVAAHVGRKLAEKVDTSLNLAYAGLGDYWGDIKGLADTPDDIWKATLVLNVPF